MSLTNDAANRLAMALQQNSAIGLQQARLLRMALPQVWGQEELKAHYPAWGIETIKAMLAEHSGWKPGGPGQRLAVHLDHVLRLDEHLAKEAACPV